ncbi:hypothetical protein PG996_014651 [Apiospora saccharicola]|uniref:SMP-LTD domain-containing protein n=1 Tax=Apiospora saccharicola TaxID=335842 RepID=A0ABR1TJ08_9PEZI
MNWKKILINFIEDIPDEKLQGFRLVPGTLHKDNNFRLNMLGLTTGAGEYNLQIQINNGILISSLKEYASMTVAGPVLVPQSFVESSAAKSDANQKDAKNANDKPNGDAEPATLDPDAIRQGFKATMRTLAEIVGPGKQGQKDQKGKNGKK